MRTNMSYYCLFVSSFISSRRVLLFFSENFTMLNDFGGDIWIHYFHVISHILGYNGCCSIWDAPSIANVNQIASNRLASIHGLDVFFVTVLCVVVFLCGLLIRLSYRCFYLIDASYYHLSGFSLVLQKLSFIEWYFVRLFALTARDEIYSLIYIVATCDRCQANPNYCRWNTLRYAIH